jgi:hypothetical protein
MSYLKGKRIRENDINDSYNYSKTLMKNKISKNKFNVFISFKISGT